MKPQNTIMYYDAFAKEYDPLSKAHAWYSPEVLFGLVFEFTKKGQSLLDIGIGTGQSSEPFKKVGLHISGIEGSKEMLKRCKRKKIAEKLKVFDLHRSPLPYKVRSFDHVISNGVFYFFSDLEHFFADVKPILKKGGIFSFTVEKQKSGYTKKYVNKDNDLISERLIKKAGVIVYRHAEEYIQGLIKKYNFQLLKKLEYFAYHSPTEIKDIYFQAYVLRKK